MASGLKMAYLWPMPLDGITLKNLTLSYQRHPAVHHLSGNFPQGSMTAIMGPNGGGKSTLIKALAGLHPIDEGAILRAPRLDLKNTAYLPQSNSWDRDFPITVFELASQALLPELGYWRRPDQTQIERVNSALEQVGMIPFRNRNIGHLSLGQFQRALFARVIVQNAQLVLLDEPLNGLDEKATTDLFVQLQRWNSEGKTLIVVLHDRHLVLKHFQTTLILSQEGKAWGPTNQVLRAPVWQQTVMSSPAFYSEEECSR